MEIETIQNVIRERFSDLLWEEQKGSLCVLCPSDKLIQLCEFVRSYETGLSFDFLFFLTAVDWKTHLEVVYQLTSTKHPHSLRIKVKLENRENPEIESVSGIWSGAEPHEREAYDFFGIRFLNNKRLNRIFLGESWKGWPLRKDYKDPIHLVERS